MIVAILCAYIMHPPDCELPTREPTVDTIWGMRAATCLLLEPPAGAHNVQPTLGRSKALCRLSLGACATSDAEGQQRPTIAASKVLIEQAPNRPWSRPMFHRSGRDLWWIMSPEI